MRPRALTARPRTLVCGTGFGQVYLRAFAVPDFPFTLAGILASGSARSQACADAFGVPLLTRVQDVPADTELACVVVPGALLGGVGAELAAALLDRGIPVLHEHPLHADELAALLRRARAARVGYRLTSFHSELPAVRRFLGAARELLRRREPRFLDVTCAYQVGYAVLDVLGAVFGQLRPTSFEPAPAPPRAGYRVVTGELAGVPLTLRVQNQLDPSDPDGRPHTLYRMTLGTDTGSLLLADAHGPVLWLPRPRFPSMVHDPGGAVWAGRADRQAEDGVRVLGPVEDRPQDDVYGLAWPEAAGRALTAFRREVEAGEDPLRRGAYHLALCRAWQTLSTALGPPEPVHADPVPVASAEELDAVADAGERAVAEHAPWPVDRRTAEVVA
jgi:thiazolinyl imide reductase